MNDVPQSLKELLCSVLNVPPDKVTMNLSPKVNRNWDSVRHVELVMEIEKRYGVTFSTAEIFTLTSVRGICDALVKKKGTDAL